MGQQETHTCTQEWEDGSCIQNGQGGCPRAQEEVPLGLGWLLRLLDGALDFVHLGCEGQFLHAVLVL